MGISSIDHWNGALALAEAKKRCPDTPFILVSGAVTEDPAIEILSQGAKDYVLKTWLRQRLGQTSHKETGLTALRFGVPYLPRYSRLQMVI
jgi:DNA-binding NtrC family response regulator